MKRWSLGGAVALLLTCTSALAQDRIVVLGDSVMTWNALRRGAVADVLARTLDRPVENRAVSGARFSHDTGIARLFGLDIRTQFDFAPTEWVVMTGGANDLRAECGCVSCSETLDGLISADGRTGEVPEFVARVAASGARIVWVLYYDSPEGPPTPFTACRGAFDELDARLDRLARIVPALTLADAGPLIDPATAADYAPDRIHPSVDASRRIGRLVAGIIAASP
ncbi:SGNH/GDSL hydrolase family protein [Histidinibacterium lentulum]|uniref:SGNH/GDSL hydrolase family protein n=1 Tax=Histidinibacterium lentulum TaxID=2480588 RepID=A0A3N2R7S8_9RHOB|nr:SGNH/GDSL hydrolase family protein [Histidinibacterium lentulum]ROU03519.1 SGNH/GDSL hydrolase family protein [Histidinibacterium lentulum]